jgi:hypothetical protein
VDDCGDRSDEEPCKTPDLHIPPTSCYPGELTCSAYENVTRCVPQTAR